MHLPLEECLHKLSGLCLKSKSPYCVRDLQNLKDIFTILKDCDCSPSIISTWFNLQGHLLSLECLWQLQANNLIQFTSYIYFNADSVVQLSEDFEALIWCQEDALREECSECVATLVCVLVNLGGHTPRDICKPGHQLLRLVVEMFVDRLLNPLSVEEPVPFFPRLVGSVEVVPSKLRAFCLSLLRTMVQVEPEAVSMQEAIQHQAEKFTLASSPTPVSQTLTEIFSKLTAEDVLTELTFWVTSLQGQFNWCWILTAVSAFVQSSNQGITCFKGVIEGWVTQACASKNISLLTSALLIARQCCAENSHKFGSYSTWFGGLMIRPASAFTFFFEFLSTLVPYEPVLCLKIHVNKVPSPPPNCHGVIADYVALAKTRLLDLRQSTDYLGLFGEYTTTEQEGRKSDVTKVVAHFKQTNEVMKIVLEASVFRRQFYEEVFLTELLKDNNSEHVGLIKKLHSLGKIPHVDENDGINNTLLESNEGKSTPMNMEQQMPHTSRHTEPKKTSKKVVSFGEEFHRIRMAHVKEEHDMKMKVLTQELKAKNLELKYWEEMCATIQHPPGSLQMQPLIPEGAHFSTDSSEKTTFDLVNKSIIQHSDSEGD